MDDLRQQGVCTDLLGAHQEGLVAVDRAATHGVAHAFVDGDRLAGDHGFVDGGGAFGDAPVDGDLVARLDAEHVPEGDLVDGDLDLLAVDEFGGVVGGELEQFFDGGAGAGVRAGLEHLAEQHERKNDGGGLEVDVDLAGDGLELRREEVGKQQPEDAKEPGHPGADTDEGKHVEPPRDDAAPGALEEHPRGVEDDRERERELDPVPRALLGPSVERVARNHFAHGDEEDRNGEGGRDPELAQQRTVAFLLGRDIRFDRHEVHAADRAGAGGGADDLGVHGAGVLLGPGGGEGSGEGLLGDEVHAADGAIAGAVVGLGALAVHRAVEGAGVGGGLRFGESRTVQEDGRIVTRFGWRVRVRSGGVGLVAIVPVVTG